MFVIFALKKVASTFQKISFTQILCFFLLADLLNLLYYWSFFNQNHYLPAPFMWDKYDDFMDFYNPLFWVIKDGFYTTFHSVYPPLNYFFLKLFSFGINSTEVIDPIALRKNHLDLLIPLLAFYSTILFLSVYIGEWKKIQIINRLLMWLVSILSISVLLFLSRGNLIFLALLFFTLYLATPNPYFKAIFLAFLINIKPYFILLCMQYLNIYNFDKNLLLKSFMAGLIIFLTTSFIVGLNIFDFIKFFFSFSKGIGSDGVLAYTNSLTGLFHLKGILIYGQRFSVGHVHTYSGLFGTVLALAYLVPLILLFIAILKPLNKLELLLSSVIFITNFSYVFGGYVLLFYLPVIAYLLDSSEYKKLNIFIFMILFLPLDWINLISVSFDRRYSFLGGIIIENPIFWISFGQIARPILNFAMMGYFIYLLIKKYGGFRIKNPHLIRLIRSHDI